MHILIRSAGIYALSLVMLGASLSGSAAPVLHDSINIKVLENRLTGIFSEHLTTKLLIELANHSLYNQLPESTKELLARGFCNNAYSSGCLIEYFKDKLRKEEKGITKYIFIPLYLMTYGLVMLQEGLAVWFVYVDEGGYRSTLFAKWITLVSISEIVGLQFFYNYPGSRLNNEYIEQLITGMVTEASHDYHTLQLEMLFLNAQELHLEVDKEIVPMARPRMEMSGNHREKILADELAIRVPYTNKSVSITGELGQESVQNKNLQPRKRRVLYFLSETPEGSRISITSDENEYYITSTQPAYDALQAMLKLAGVKNVEISYDIDADDVKNN